jgi:predicted molibdopterin-dependent oxidoreductase YjgC
MPTCGTIGSFPVQNLDGRTRPAVTTVRKTPMKQGFQRLTQPLVREGAGLRAASWDEALERAARGFERAVRDGGPRSFGLFSCSKTTNELNYLTQKFARAVIGTNNVDSCNRT